MMDDHRKAVRIATFVQTETAAVSGGDGAGRHGAELTR